MKEQLLDTRDIQGDPPTTRWSMVRAMAGDATMRREALEMFAGDYWPAIYAFARRKGHPPEEAEDITQAFLADLIERESFTDLAAEKGRFRSWLLACLHNFLRADWRDRKRLKRGGAVPHVSIDRELGEGWLEQYGADELSPDVVFDRRWAAGILERALREVRDAYECEGKLELARVLAPVIAGADSRQSYAEAAAKLGISESNARVAAFRMRKRVRSRVREEVAAMVASPDQVDDELRELLALFGAGGVSSVG